MRAMILAAGRGERMRPLTDRTPKPLLAAGGKPLIVHHLERLKRAGIDDVVVNVAWLGERIEEVLGDGARFGVRIRYSREPDRALETAGGIYRALPLLGNAPFLVVSADVFCDFEPAALTPLADDALAHLVLVDNPAHHPNGDFALDGQQVRLDGGRRLTFAGIGVFRPAAFEHLEPGVHPLRPVLERHIVAGRVTGQRHAGAWLDTGTPGRLEALRRRLG